MLSFEEDLAERRAQDARNDKIRDSQAAAEIAHLRFEAAMRMTSGSSVSSDPLGRSSEQIAREIDNQRDCDIADARFRQISDRIERDLKSRRSRS